MNFILPFTPAKPTHSIGYDQNMLCLGSCFAQEIGELLKSHRFQVMINPHGILFNSISIALALNEYIDDRQYTSADLVLENNLWHSLNHHGRFSSVNKEQCLENINKEISSAHQYLKKTNWLLVTLGTSWVYRSLATKGIVSNCHKIPQRQFEKELLSSKIQIDGLQQVIQRLLDFNSQLRIVFTVSPVRYLRDGLVENNLSKAQLLHSVHTLCSNNKQCSYFPAYELVLDVLRDYRFYKEDLVHPSEQAVQFVWENFMGSYLNTRDKDLYEEIQDYNKYNRHKKINTLDSKLYDEKQAFMLSNMEKSLDLRRREK